MTGPDGATPLVCVVVLNWNSPAQTIECLKALAASDYPNMRTIVVDNGSAEPNVAPLIGFPGIELVRNPVNLGFTGGVNVGIEHAMARGADYVWLLNSDAEVAPSVLGQLVHAAESDPKVGLVSPVFHDPDAPETPEFCLGLFDPVSRYATQTADPAQAALWQRDHPDRVVLLGTALLVRGALIGRIGGLDAGFFAYVEDVDYGLRTVAAGFRAIAVPDAVVLHKFKEPMNRPGSVPPYLHYFMSRNYLLLWRKLPGGRIFDRAGLWFFRQRLLQISRMENDRDAIDAVLAGIWDGLRGMTGPYDRTRQPPRLLRSIFGRHATFWLCLLDRRLPLGRGTPR